MKTLSNFIYLTVILLVSTSCSKDNNDMIIDINELALDLVGAWTFTYDNDQITYVFNPDNSGEKIVNQNKREFAWVAKNKIVNITFNDGTILDFEYEKTPNTLILKSEDDEAVELASVSNPAISLPDWANKYWKRDGVDTYIDLTAHIPVFCIDNEVSTVTYGGYFSEINWHTESVGYFTWFTDNDGNYTFKLEKNGNSLIVSTYDARLNEFYDEANYSVSYDYPCNKDVNPDDYRIYKHYRIISTLHYWADGYNKHSGSAYDPSGFIHKENIEITNDELIFYRKNDAQWTCGFYAPSLTLKDEIYEEGITSWELPVVFDPYDVDIAVSIEKNYNEPFNGEEILDFYHKGLYISFSREFDYAYTSTENGFINTAPRVKIKNPHAEKPTLYIIRTFNANNPIAEGPYGGEDWYVYNCYKVDLEKW
jgi:hypothetical protein